jgi:threonine aldolase
MDGARLLNASVATGRAPADFTRGFHSAFIDLSKGLGCPAGAVLAGSDEFISNARAWRQRLGGAMRQAGILAAAGLFALRHNVDRLATDHARARRLSELLVEGGALMVNHPPQTNIVLMDTTGLPLSGGQFVQALSAHQVRASASGRNVVRFVTHLDLEERDIEMAASSVLSVIEQGRRR